MDKTFTIIAQLFPPRKTERPVGLTQLAFRLATALFKLKRKFSPRCDVFEHEEFAFADSAHDVNPLIGGLGFFDDFQFAHIAQVILIVDGDGAASPFLIAFRLYGSLQEAPAFLCADGITGFILASREGVVQQFLLNFIMKKTSRLGSFFRCDYFFRITVSTCSPLTV